MNTFTHYTLGFVFNFERTHVLLIRKTKPAWQNDKLNGIGGKVEGLEGELECIKREFHEETNINPIYNVHWKAVGNRQRLSSENGGSLFKMRIFAGELPLDVMKQAYSSNDETIEVVPLDYNAINNEGVQGLVWTINAALCALNENFVFSVDDL